MPAALKIPEVGESISEVQLAQGGEGFRGER